MATTTLLDGGQPQRQRLRQTELVGDLRQQSGPCVRHQTRSVRADFYGYRASVTHHPQGEPPSSGSRTFDKPRIPAQPDVSAPPPTGGAVLTARSGLAPQTPGVPLIAQSASPPGPYECYCRAIAAARERPWHEDAGVESHGGWPESSRVDLSSL